MDPLSVIASVVGILGAAAKISSVIVDVTKKSKHAPQSVKEIKTEVDNFRVVLEQLQAFVMRKRSVNLSRASWILVNQVVVVLSGSVITFSELEVFVDSLHSDNSIGILDRLRWATKASTATELLGKVQSHKLSIVTMLMILESQSALDAEEAVNTLASLVERALKSNPLIEERLLSVELGALTVSHFPGKSDSPEPGPQDEIDDFRNIENVQRTAQGFAFEEELSNSWVYKRANNNDEGFSVISAAGRSASWSMLSGLSMSDVSNVSILALPIYEEDIANRLHYKFGDPGAQNTSPQSEGFQKSESERSSSSLRSQVKGWWRSSGRKQNRSTQALAVTDEIFGVALVTSIRYANIAISVTDENGSSYIYGYIPVIVGKCGVFLKKKGVEVEEIFHQNGFAPRIQQLQEAFNSPDRYGKGLNWEGYTIHDAANVLLRYLKLLPEPIIPFEFYEDFRRAFLIVPYPLPEMDLGAGVGTEHIRDETLIVRALQRCITELPPLSRQLLLYIIDLCSVIAAKDDINKMTAIRLAACYHPAILSRRPDQMIEEEHDLAHKIVAFMIEKQDNFLIGMSGRLKTSENWGDGGNDSPAIRDIDGSNEDGAREAFVWLN